jgi:acetoin:2,6-dichlorophenolindophenol oxidoreductase subunit alpha
MLPDISRERQLAILRKMLMIRRAEEHCVRFNDEHTGLIRGHFHVYIGQEATGVSVCDWLNADDYVFTTHRNHGHVIAKGGDPKKVLAEIIGRASGYCQGRAGTFHVAAPEIGVIHTSAIVGGCLALAGGTAYAAQVKASKSITVVFFGDGAMEEGVFYEALNIAKLWQLPMIFWMENNYRRSGRGAGHAALELTNIPKALDVEATVIDGIDVGTVHQTAKDIVDRVRAGQGPLFVEARTHLWPGNAFNMPKLVGGTTDIAWAWDPSGAPEKVRDWHKSHDPILNYVRELAGAGVARAELEKIDADVRKQADEAAKFALESPLPQPQDAVKYAFAGEGN